MVQSIKSFLSKHEDLNLMPQNPHVKVCACNLSAVEAESGLTDQPG